MHNKEDGPCDRGIKGKMERQRSIRSRVKSLVEKISLEGIRGFRPEMCGEVL